MPVDCAIFQLQKTRMKYVLFFPHWVFNQKNIVNGRNGPEFCVLAQRQICVICRNNRHIKMVAKLSFQPKKNEVPLRVSTKFNKTGVEWKATLPFMPLVVALATKMSYNSQNYYHDWPVHYLATLSQFHNSLSVLFRSAFAWPDFICDNQSRLPCESFGLLCACFFKSRLLFLWGLSKK